ncbi:MAG TPA: G8 domain-containing protein, partial [Dongiaceae bacterium]|nr:G8 domain-containing protein [Dongiaceae bacterium]
MPDQAMGVAMTSVLAEAALCLRGASRWLTVWLLLTAAMAVSAFPGMATADQNMVPLKASSFGKNAPPSTAKGCDGTLSAPSLKEGGGDAPGQVDDLVISTPCKINRGATYYYGQINIVGPNGSLTITEPTSTNKDISIWASSIIIENGGKLIAGTATAPYGSNGGTLTFYIYGADASKGKDP